MFITSPKAFAEWFNEKYLGAYRQITTEDVEKMKSCELIHRYGFYSTSQDGKTVMGILKYEQLRENRSVEQDKENKLSCCKFCGQPLPPNPGIKAGRPKEYCSECEPHRNRDRQKRLRNRCTQTINGFENLPSAARRYRDALRVVEAAVGAAASIDPAYRLRAAWLACFDNIAAIDLVS